MILRWLIIIMLISSGNSCIGYDDTSLSIIVGTIASQSSLVICNDNEYIGALLTFSQEIGKYVTDRACEVMIVMMMMIVMLVTMKDYDGNGGSDDDDEYEVEAMMMMIMLMTLICAR